jgi:hypothetical protein
VPFDNVFQFDYFSASLRALMPTLPCPLCLNPTPRTIDGATAISSVNYYRCDSSGTVWHVAKADPYGPIQIVAEGVLPKTPRTNQD